MGSPQSYNPTGAMEIVPINENGLITTFSLTASAVQILTTAKVGRVSVMFQYIQTTGTAFIGHTSAVTTTGATRGWELGVGDSFSLDFGDDVTFFVIGSGVIADAFQAWEI